MALRPSASESSWNLLSLGHPLTVRLGCWWCGARVHYHTDGQGEGDVFDPPAERGQVHACWEDHPDEHTYRIKRLERELELQGYDGADTTFVLERTLTRLKKKTKKPDRPVPSATAQGRLLLDLRCDDHNILDKSVAELARVVRQGGGQLIGPLPKPTETIQETPEDGPTRSILMHRRVLIVPGASPHLVAQLAQTQVPSGVQVALQQA